MKIQLIVLFTLLTCSCSSNATKTSQNKQTVQAQYMVSDVELNKTFKKINNNSPKLLKINLKTKQREWLKKRGKICHYQKLEHPKNPQILDCFIKQNDIRINELINKKYILEDLLDKQFVALNREDPKSIEKITNMSFDNLNRLTVEVINVHGSRYQIIFDKKENSIYGIILFGQWGVISEKNETIVGTIGIKEQYISEIKNICNAFDG